LDQLVDNFVDRLAQARMLDELGDVAEYELQRLGFSGFTYWNFLRLPLDDIGAATTFVYSRGPAYLKALEAMYYRRKMFQKDPFWHHAMIATRPFSSDDLRQGREMTRAQRWVQKLERRFGLNYDICVPMNTPKRYHGFYAFVIGGSEQTRAEISAAAPMVAELALRFGNCATDFVDFSAIRDYQDLFFSRREQECLTWMAKGRSNAEIGEVLEISENTVKFHVTNIMRKLNAANRTEAVALAVRSGWITT